MGHNPMEIKHNQMVVKKENKGDEGSNEFNSNYTAATEALKPAFGGAKLLVLRTNDGNEAGAGNTNYTYIEEFFCINLTHVDIIEHHVVSYNLKEILMIKDLNNARNVDPQVKWGPSKHFWHLLFYFNSPMKW